jgi:transcriptional regulator with XRE-family HTH domain
MHFQQALVTIMETRNVSLEELAARTNANPRWLLAITTNSEWTPKLDTILRLCHALRFNVFAYLALAEAGSQSNNSNIQVSKYRSTDQSIKEHLNQILDLQPRHISMALRSYRIECGFSLRTLEKMTPFNVHTICMREGVRYENYPTVTTLYSYCDAYEISLEEFVKRAFSFIDDSTQEDKD